MPGRFASHGFTLAGALLLGSAPPLFAAVDFVKDIQPILADRCYKCHGPEKHKSELRLDQPASILRGGESGEPVLVPGKPDQSHIIQLITEPDPTKRMPRQGDPLTPAQVGAIKEWIAGGAKMPDAPLGPEKLTTQHWSFQPLKPVSPPAIKDPFIANPIDAFILAKLREAKLSPSPRADRVTLIRRLYLEVLGLPPTPEEVAAFIADRDALAWEHLVDRVLASPRYGEMWARHWLDTVRFAESHGFEMNQPRPNAWRYRDYVIDALNADKPYDKFVFEQLAGDSVGEDAATGYLVAGAKDQVGSPDPILTAMQRQDELHDMVSTTGTAFMGLTIGCARCHNHKFDPITQKDYYALQAVFAGVTHGDRIMRNIQQPKYDDELKQVDAKAAAIRAELINLEPLAQTGRTILIDEEASASVTHLRPPSPGLGVNPAGTKPGYRDDPGDADHLPNLSGGKYIWWPVTPADKGANLLAYNPALAAPGKFRVWLSWGSGYIVHTTDAQYVLDLDGDLNTTADQTLLATADQQQRVGEKKLLPEQPLWSGFYDAGVHELQPGSRIVLRAGSTGTAVTADVVLLQEVLGPAGGSVATAALPSLRDSVNSRQNVEHFAPTRAKFIRFTVTGTTDAEPCIDELEVGAVAVAGQPLRNVALGAKPLASGTYLNNPAHKLEHVNDGKYGNEQSWISNQPGQGWVQIEFAQPETIDTLRWGRDRSEKYRDRVATKYVVETAEEPGKWTVVARSEDRLPFGKGATAAAVRLGSIEPGQRGRYESMLGELAKLEARQKALAGLMQNGAMAYAGTFAQPGETHRLFRGDPMAPREVVAPDALNVLATLNLPPDAPEQKRRVEYAKWVSSPQNPLTPRVMVNRIWQHHFGTGIVETPSDFGGNGIKPTHPELLDYLASTFIANGWSMKSIHRMILLSNTYQQADGPNADGLAIDAGAKLLWRYPPRRMESEPIRDSIVAVTGVLEPAMGGPGFSAFKPNENYVRVYEPKDAWGPGDFRRAIYMTKVRMRVDGVFGAFDCPDGGQVAPKRTRSTTALQALNLFNSTFILQQADLFAARLKKEAGDNSSAQIIRAFLLAYSRRPDMIESTASHDLIDKYGLPAFCRAILNSNEFLFIP
jgi:hypothetical protein